MKCFSFGAQDLCLCSITYACSDMVASQTRSTYKSSNRDAGNDQLLWLVIVGTRILASAIIPTHTTSQTTDLSIIFFWNALYFSVGPSSPTLCGTRTCLRAMLVRSLHLFFIFALTIGVITYGHRVGACCVLVHYSHLVACPCFRVRFFCFQLCCLKAFLCMKHTSVVFSFFVLLVMKRSEIDSVCLRQFALGIFAVWCFKLSRHFCHQLKSLGGIVPCIRRWTIAM